MSSDRPAAVEAMVRRFRPYPEYKDSGVEWLGKIPAHWEVRRLKHLAELNPEQLPEDTDPVTGILYVDIGGVDGLGRINEKEQLTFATAPSRARRIVRHGNVIVSTVRTYLRAIAPITDPEPGLVVSTGFAVIRPGNALIPPFAAYALRSPYLVERVVANSKGVSFPAISESELAAYELAVPPTAEQRAITGFLDRETAKIDGLVAKKQRLLQLLQERRTALIARAVTKGLDPNTPMKDSDVEWLGVVPSHWNLAKMRHISTATSGATPSKGEARYWDGQVPWISPKDMKRRVIAWSEDTVTVHAIEEAGLTLLKPPVVLVVVRGMILAQTLPVALTTVPVTINQDMKALHFRDGIDPSFVVWFLEGVGPGLLGSIVDEAAHGTRAVRMDQWNSVLVPVPPMAEQRAIAFFLERETSRIDGLIAAIRNAIDRLTEFRTALIHAAVTGQIDVREEAA